MSKLLTWNPSAFKSYLLCPTWRVFSWPTSNWANLILTVWLSCQISTAYLSIRVSQTMISILTTSGARLPTGPSWTWVTWSSGPTKLCSIWIGWNGSVWKLEISCSAYALGNRGAREIFRKFAALHTAAIAAHWSRLEGHPTSYRRYWGKSIHCRISTICHWTVRVRVWMSWANFPVAPFGALLRRSGGNHFWVFSTSPMGDFNRQSNQQNINWSPRGIHTQLEGQIKAAHVDVEVNVKFIWPSVIFNSYLKHILCTVISFPKVLSTYLMILSRDWRLVIFA